jgi:LuxR family maltose regulon positive regulatory protein
MAVHRYKEAIGEFIAADHLPDMLGCSLALAAIQIAQGRLTDAKRTFHTGPRWTTEHPGLRGAADMHAGLSEVLIERNLLDAAARHLETSNELGESAGLPQHAYRWRVTMARLRRARGDLDGALDLIEEAAPLYDTDFSPPVRPVAAIRARVQLAHGDLDSALEWATECGLTADDELSYVHEYEHITLIRVVIARHVAGHGTSALDDAIRMLDRLLAAAEKGSRTGSAIEILILQATAFEARDDTAAAVAALDDALRRAEPEGHIRLFLHAGPAVTALLRSVASREHATPHARLVLAAVDLTTTSVDTHQAARSGLVDELSSRELDVLRLLRSDLSGPEIARELHVSMNTLRTHTKSIYTKLGATSRREAIRRATEHGL